MTKFLVLLSLVLLYIGQAEEIETKAICGNGLRETGEECDDGNGNDLDGCTKNCTVEVNYKCIKDQISGKDLCYQDTQLMAELKYVQHSNPPKIELLFNHPIVYNDIVMLCTSSINIAIGQSKNGSDFSWNILENHDSKLRNQSFFIILSFSESYYKKTLKLYFLDTKNFKDIFGNTLSTLLLTVNLPSHVVFNKNSKDFMRFMKIFLVVVMILMFILCFPLSILNSMGIFWNLFDTCQLFQIMILINCDYLDPVKEFFQSFSITNFRFNDYFDDNIYEKSNYKESPALSYWLIDREYRTMFLDNAFYCLIFSGFFLFIYVIFLLFSKIHSCPASCIMKIKNLFGFSALLRATLITYTPFCLAVMLQFLNFQFKESINSINSLLALFWLFYLVILPIVYLKLLNDPELLQEDETFQDKIRPLIELMNLKAILKRNFQLFYIMRKFLWVCFIVFIGDNELDQIFWVIFVQVSIITLHMLKKPYINTKVNYMMLFAEIALLLSLFMIAVLISFDYLNADLDLDIRIGISWAIVGVLSSIVFVKLCFVVFEIVNNIRDLIPKAKRMFKKFNEDDDNFIEMGEYTMKNAGIDNSKALNFIIEEDEKPNKENKKK